MLCCVAGTYKPLGASDWVGDVWIAHADETARAELAAERAFAAKTKEQQLAEEQLKYPRDKHADISYFYCERYSLPHFWPLSHSFWLSHF